MITSSKPMVRALLCLGVAGVAAVLAGCPIYSSQSDYRVCTGSTCYDCPDPNYSNMCVAWACSADGDCAQGYSCAPTGQCLSGIGDDAAAPADCSVSGCPANQVCLLAGGTATCVLLGADSSTEDGGPGEDAALPAEAQVEASPASEASIDAPLVWQDAAVDGPSEALASDSAGASPADAASEGSAEASASVACNANGDCAVRSWCIDGQCVVQDELCSDGSQCEVQGESCVNGVCVPRCTAGTPCPTGYACDFSLGLGSGLGVCDVNPAACTGSGASSCQGGAVCVQSHCVPPCSAGDAGAACPGGQVCVNGGCIPDQKALFACRNDGASGQLANACDPASVCVHHDCYAVCDGDGGGCPAAQCKQVTVRAGTYAVCGSPTTLGSDCDLAAGAACPSSGVCVDGFCR